MNMVIAICNMISFQPFHQHLRRVKLSRKRFPHNGQLGNAMPKLAYAAGVYQRSVFINTSQNCHQDIRWDMIHVRLRLNVDQKKPTVYYYALSVSADVLSISRCRRVDHLSHTVPYDNLTVHYRTVPVPYRTIPYSSIRSGTGTVPYRTVPYRTVPYRYRTIHSNT